MAEEQELTFRRVNARLTPELYEKLAQEAKDRGLSIQAVTVLAIETYLAKEKD
ncbi:hypothetical protein OR571_22575 [Psychrobacillus sp. NEAU-3TGS]|uniref:hypothetical protein n=1 Tax=Psychrobacillus sp. NEAU-3TGS TaxID=2995412 RepID=UPI002497F24F|nr:hypothetical protein [Psychrobacillus sp. NEAU-3TGS]MDI2589814.1 hypothetical protein [Psychrobacillus sp. NEAU-3TGS]